jgi:hypothetical protein
MDGFDYYNGFGPGGRKWDQGSSAIIGGGRFGGQSGAAVWPPGMVKTFPNTLSGIIIGFAQHISAFTEPFGSFEAPYRSFLTFWDGTTAQCSLRFNPITWLIEVIPGTVGYGGAPTTPIGPPIITTTYVPPLTLWYFIEVKIGIGTSGYGTIEVRVNGSTVGLATGVATQTSLNASINKISFNSPNSGAQGIQGGVWNLDDLYIINPNDGNGAVDFLGECRIQTKVPDADGYQTDFLRSTGLVNAYNANTLPVTFADTGSYNYSGSVGAIDLYSVQNFTVSGTIFAVQENISFKKDDVGNREVAPILRTAAQNYIGPYNYSTITNPQKQAQSFFCFSNYTYGSCLWENNPATEAPWDLTDLNLTEFGVTVTT